MCGREICRSKRSKLPLLLGLPKMIEEHFLNWIDSNVSPYTFLSEYFYGDVEVTDEKSRKDLMYKWLLAAYEEGYKCGKDINEIAKELDGVVEHYSCSDNYTTHKKIIIKYDVKSKG